MDIKSNCFKLAALCVFLAGALAAYAINNAINNISLIMAICEVILSGILLSCAVALLDGSYE